MNVKRTNFLLYIFLVSNLVTAKKSVKNLKEWLESKGGYVNPNIEVKPGVGVYALRDIQPRELIIGIPPEARIGSFTGETDVSCGTIRKLQQEQSLGTKSNYAPLIEYLTAGPFQSPSSWSDEGKKILDEIMEAFPGAPVADWAHSVWVERCGGKEYPDQIDATMAAIETNREGMLLPFVNDFRHRNGIYGNIERYGPPAETLEYRAKHLIRKGEELTMSFENDWDSISAFQTIGQIQEYPQYWFLAEDVMFVLEEKKDQKGLPAGSLEVDWMLATLPDGEDSEFLEDLVDTVKTAAATDLTNLPKREAEALSAFTSSLSVALTEGLRFANDGVNPPETLNLPKPTNVATGDPFLDWFLGKGGYLSAKVQKKIVDGGAPRTGLFAVDDILTDEVVIVVPRSIVMSDQSDEFSMFTDHVTCEAAEVLLEEFEKGSGSEYAEFAHDILNSPHPKLPSEYSFDGKAVLREILGPSEDFPLTILPPADATILLSDDWQDQCSGYDGPVAEAAAARSVQFAKNNNFIPIMHWIYPGNGVEVNIKSNEYEGENDFIVRASRPIRAGEEIRTSISECIGCGWLPLVYGTAELYRDFGVVESYPQFWIFDEGLQVQILEILDEQGLPTGSFQPVFIDEYEPGEEELDILEEELARLDFLDQTSIMDLPSNELEPIAQYGASLKVAIRAILGAFGRDTNVAVECDNDEECKIHSFDIDSLERREREILNMWNTSNCDKEYIFRFPGYQHMESVNGLYQSLDYYVQEGGNETQLQLDGIVQIAFDHRPHYHELHIQYASRFLTSDIKRIVWIGGGDSMLLHEILKYPSIELAVGLELDQNVTRYSYKYFGTQPHWDNEKVEWWYGDATKSLLMLPREYFGSFDLVLVDLSETVMSFKVTDKLSVVGALSLLMKSDGIFVKNDYHFTELSGIFENTLQIFATDIPTVCVQAMSLGSNSLNFMDVFENNLRDHGVERLYLMDNDRIDDIFHDFRLNKSPFHLDCDPDEGSKANNKSTQERSSGILYIVEVEGASTQTLLSQEAVEDTILKAMQQTGMAPVDRFSNEHENEVPFVFIILKEGYIRAHSWKNNGYCAIDIHFWGSYEKQVKLKHALLQAFDSPKSASSSYRLVAGGLFGVSTWRLDEATKGPNFQPECKSVQAPPDEERTAEDAVKGSDEETLLANTFLTSILGIRETSSRALVFCGESTNACTSLAAMRDVVGENQVTEVKTCSTVIELNEFAENFDSIIQQCILEVRNSIAMAVQGGSKFDTIVLDPSLSYTMGRVVYEALSIHRLRLQSFTKSPMLLAPSAPSDYEWRRNILDRLKYEHLKVDPIYLVETDFSKDATMIKTALLCWGMEDNSFWRKYNRVREKWSADKLDVRTYNILGGNPKYVPEHNPHKFVASDYDPTDAVKQFQTQQATALQAHFQFESSGELDGKTIEEALSKALLGVRFVPDGGVKTVSNLGEGALFVASFGKGDVVALWDGRSHLDIDLFMYREDLSLVQKFEGRITNQMPELHIALRDVFPRGFGRNVSFKKDFPDKATLPHWAY